MRSLAEWLLLPLFLLPVVAAGGLVLWARSAQDARLAPFREDARATVRAWLAPPDGPAAWMAERVARAFLPGGSGLGDEAAYVAVEHPRGRPRVRLVGHALGSDAWLFADALPAGLPAALFTDAAVRLELERGLPALRLDAVDEGTRMLARLLREPDVDGLREAGLPAATKGFVLRRWRDAGVGDPRLADAERLVDAVRRWELDGQERQAPARVGSRSARGLLVVETGGPSPVLLPDGGRGLPVQVLTETDGDEGPVRLSWIFPPDAPSGMHEVWRGEVAAPLAGTFLFSAPRGTAWWASSAARRWGPPTAALLLLFLALPVFLLGAMRRRRRLDEARARFLNEMAHDLRTPLTSLRLHADLLTEGRGKPERRDAYVERIATESARLSDLLENLLDIARLERGRRRFELQRVRVGEALEGVVAAFGRLRPERRGDLVLDGDAGLAVRADSTALDRVLANLLDNAGKFTPAGTPIRVTWRTDGGRVEIDVADEGPGIDPAERGRVFDRYVRGRRAAEGGLPGSGLGLALARELVEGMGGTLGLVTSERGATFRVELPGASDA